MKKLRNLLALLAIVVGITSGYAFTSKPFQSPTGIFLLDPVTGNLVTPYVQLPPQGPNVDWVCTYWPTRYCTGVYAINASGNPVGPRLSTTMGTFNQ